MSTYKSAKDIASDRLFYIDGLATVADAIRLMREQQVDYLFIQKRNEQDANGIIVVSDIVRGVLVKDLDPAEVSVYEIMTKPVLSIPAGMNCRYVSRLLIRAGLYVAPVEEGGTFVGVVHLHDLVFNV